MKRIVLAAAVIIVLFLLLGMFAGIYLDWLWFGSLGFAGVFLTRFLSGWGTRILTWLIFALFLFLNLNYTRKAIMEMPNPVLRQLLINSALGNLLTPKRLQRLFLGIAIVTSWLATTGYKHEWMTVRLFWAGDKTGIVEPIFGRDVSFYLFGLPFWDLIYRYLFFMLIVTVFICGAIYLLIQPPQQLGLRALFVRRGTTHLSVLLAAAFLVRAYGYRMQMYGLLNSPRGAVYGPTYTDLHAYLPGYWILLVLAILAAVALLLNLKFKATRLLIGSIVAMVAATFILHGIFPAAVQKFIVEPNEYAREEPYLQHNIEFTRQAFGLDQIDERKFALADVLSYEELVSDRETIDNIRLWDWRPIRQTYNQLQGLRRYYNFYDVDTDRYEINGKKRQVMIAARELVPQQLTAPTWVNTRLVYTHGYGAVVSPVNEVTSQGLPYLALRDFPVQGEKALQIEVPQIYYGELTDTYVFTNTKTDEFDYPMGDTNAFTRYEGSGGILLKNLLRRFLLALHFGDYRILISGELTPDSRIHFKRNIQERLQELFPYLEYDEDPYLVIADGRLFWLCDAYSTSSLYPYAQPYGRINYIRNSVKVTVDAYNGDVRFYVFAPEDPLIKAYDKIFPHTFLPAEEMPATLRAHIRYPERLFKIQADVYATYHMQDRKVFYNKEDLWQTPRESYGDEMIPMEPYYTLLRLPEEEKAEFILMRPYTLYSRDNMVAWLAARSDEDNYGQLIVYEFPKGQLLYGPSQIEARIDQDSVISQQLSLWSQRGSSVIRGNLLVLPINDTILYVEPLYLRAQQSELPELARVIAAYGDEVVMENSLEAALAALFDLTPGAPGIDPGLPAEPEVPGDQLPALPDASAEELIIQAATLYEEAQIALRNGDWAEYGRLQDELGKVLLTLQQLTTPAEQDAAPETGE